MKKKMSKLEFSLEEKKMTWSQAFVCRKGLLHRKRICCQNRNKFNDKQGRFRLTFKNNFLTARTVKCWKRLHREVAESLGS